MKNTRKVWAAIMAVLITCNCIIVMYIEFAVIKKTTTDTISPFKNLLFSEDDICAINGIHKKFSFEDNVDVTCKDHIPSKKSCIYTKETYAYDSKNTCKGKSTLEICKFTGKKQLFCEKSICGDEPVLIHIIDPKSGKIIVAKEINKRDHLTYFVLQYSKQSSVNGFHFLFLSCGKNKTRTQLLILENNLFTNFSIPSNSERKINVNLIMFDSVSRPHFYRSLQKTTKAMSEINMKSDAEFLDFEKFQAVHGHTLESSRTLFTGSPFPINFTREMQLRAGVGIDTFMNHFQKHGYHTLYQDDMCWKTTWGIRMDLGKPIGNWIDLVKKINQSSIQSTGKIIF